MKLFCGSRHNSLTDLNARYEDIQVHVQESASPSLQSPAAVLTPSTKLDVSVLKMASFIMHTYTTSWCASSQKGSTGYSTRHGKLNFFRRRPQRHFAGSRAVTSRHLSSKSWIFRACRCLRLSISADLPFTYERFLRSHARRNKPFAVLSLIYTDFDC